MRKTLRRLLIVSGALLMLVVAACSSGSAGSSSAGSGAATGAAATSSGPVPAGAIKIFVMGTFSSPQESVPGALQGAEAAADSINASGGINGKKIAIISCNDQSDPNQAAACARQAVADHVNELTLVKAVE